MVWSLAEVLVDLNPTNTSFTHLRSQRRDFAGPEPRMLLLNHKSVQISHEQWDEDTASLLRWCYATLEGSRRLLDSWLLCSLSSDGDQQGCQSDWDECVRHQEAPLQPQSSDPAPRGPAHHQPANGHQQGREPGIAPHSCFLVNLKLQVSSGKRPPWLLCLHAAAGQWGSCEDSHCALASEDTDTRASLHSQFYMKMLIWILNHVRLFAKCFLLYCLNLMRKWG